VANLDVQIQALAGTAEQTEMDDWASEGVIEIINALPDDVLEPYASPTALNNSTETLSNCSLKRIYRVTREETSQGPHVECREVSLHEFNKSSDSNSIYEATVTSPCYNISGDTLSVSPTPTALELAFVYNYEYPRTLDVSTIYAIDNVPHNVTYLVVLYVAAKVLHNKMVEANASLPSLPSSFVLPSPPAGVDIDFSDVGTLEEFVTPTMDTPDWDDANTWISTEEDSEMLAARIQEISGKIQEYSTHVQKESTRVQASLNDYQQKVSKAIQTYQAETGYDLSKYQAEVSAEAQRYGSDVQEFGNSIQKLTTDYQWLQGQYAQVKQDYMQGLQQLMGGGAPQGG
jgi:hypothetical protein